MARRRFLSYEKVDRARLIAAAICLFAFRPGCETNCIGADAQSSATENSFPCETVGNVSDDFQTRVAQTWKMIPPTISKQMLQRGWKVRLAPFVVDAAPELDGVPPRGWPAGSTWNNTDAVHLSDRRILIFAEKRQTRDGRVLKSNRVTGVICHEVGHALDLAYVSGSRVSSSDRFQRAYLADVKTMEDQVADNLAYYLQNTDIGRQEAFAEAFAVLIAGGSDVDLKHEFRNAFPTVIDTVRSIVSEYARTD